MQKPNTSIFMIVKKYKVIKKIKFQRVYVENPYESFCHYCSTPLNNPFCRICLQLYHTIHYGYVPMKKKG